MRGLIPDGAREEQDGTEVGKDGYFWRSTAGELLRYLSQLSFSLQWLSV